MRFRRIQLYSKGKTRIMARVKWFENEQIVVYIYGELYEKHHVRHVLILKKDEDCQYGFDGQPVKGTKRLRKKSDHDLVSAWIIANSDKLEIAWDLINKGINPGRID